MNFTVDDSDPSFAYSDNGWAVQAADDPDLDQFFQDTYHVATVNGASVSFQFQGMAFALYGSKGPGHSKYQVQFDSTVVNLDASADETAFRQELFSHSFSANESAQHLVKVTAVFSGDGVQGKWLDVDYITFTSGTGTTSAIGTATSSPPWATESSQSQTSTSSVSSGGANSSTSSSSTSHLSTILAVLFGALIGVFIVGLIVYLILRRIHDRRRSRERQFRYGQSSVNPSPAPYYTASAKGSSTAGTNGVLDTVAGIFSPASAAASRTRSSSQAGTLRSDYPPPSAYSHGASMSGGGGTAVEMRSVSLDARDGPTPVSARPLMSSSPIAWATRTRTGGPRSDADSMRTDFLQV